MGFELFILIAGAFVASFAVGAIGFGAIKARRDTTVTNSEGTSRWQTKAEVSADS